MRTIALVVGLALVMGCARDESVLFEDVEGWYSISGDAVSCPDADSITQQPESGPPTQILCGWYCVEYDGRLAHSVFLEFTRPDESSRWALVSVSHDESRLEECAQP